jgi:aminobutyraldehyde dehydrogenase
MNQPIHTDLFIDGGFVPGEGEAENVLNPATGQTLALVKEASLEQVHKAVSAAHRAFDAWADTTPMERSRMLLKLADAIDALCARAGR